MQGSRVLASLFIVFVCLHAVSATLWIPNFFTSYMVLHRSKQNCISGNATANAQVKMNITNTSPGISKDFQTVIYTANAKSDSTFSICIPTSLFTQYKYTTFNMLLSDTNSTKNFVNLIFGEVWLCSGQSNMQYSVQSAFDGPAIMASNRSDLLRFINVRTFNTTTVQEDILPTSWYLGTSSNLGYFSAVCYAFGNEFAKQLGIPVGLIGSSWGGTTVTAWSSWDALKKCNYSQFYQTSNNAPTGLYNAMIYPLRRLSVTGFLWYQGEQDSGNPIPYECWFPNMITNWRTLFNDATMPFGFVQLTAFPINEYTFSGYDIMRYAQLSSTQKLQNIYHTTGIDMGDPYSPGGSIHSRNKTALGQRLFRQIAYDRYALRKEPQTGPSDPSCCYTINNATNIYTIRLDFPNANSLTQIATPYCNDVATNKTMVPNSYTYCCANGPFDLTVGPAGSPYPPGNKKQFNVDSYSYSQNAAILTFNMSRYGAASTNPFLYEVRHAAANYPMCVLYNPVDPFLLPASGFNLTCTLNTVCVARPPTPAPTPKPTSAPATSSGATATPTSSGATSDATASPTSSGATSSDTSSSGATSSAPATSASAPASSTGSPAEDNAGGMLVINSVLLVVLALYVVA